MAKYESFFLISSHLFSMHKIIIMFSRIHGSARKVAHFGSWPSMAR